MSGDISNNVIADEYMPKSESEENADDYANDDLKDDDDNYVDGLLRKLLALPVKKNVNQRLSEKDESGIDE
ncbi:hypothetical protein AB6A40_008500 [Gnathostoma spinigerum]|uniref:Uncharacterized protein n=1 Tax=Gnathostoma spinigerum TaxID=75299 RepID=A0ABD6EWC3_9BILA